MELRKYISTIICEYLNENKSFQPGDILTSREMYNYIEYNKLRDSFGIIKDHNDIKEIAYSSELWELKHVKLSNFNWVADSVFNNKSLNAYPIVLDYDGRYEVLDGKHRIGMYKNMGLDKVLMWVGQMQQL